MHLLGAATFKSKMIPRELKIGVQTILCVKLSYQVLCISYFCVKEKQKSEQTNFRVYN